MRDYIIYDTETSGLEKSNGQVFQFAGVKLNESLEKKVRAGV